MCLRPAASGYITDVYHIWVVPGDLGDSAKVQIHLSLQFPCCNMGMIFIEQQLPKICPAILGIEPISHFRKHRSLTQPVWSRMATAGGWAVFHVVPHPQAD